MFDTILQFGDNWIGIWDLVVCIVPRDQYFTTTSIDILIVGLFINL